jgi:hypothetical protein
MGYSSKIGCVSCVLVSSGVVCAFLRGGRAGWNGVVQSGGMCRPDAEFLAGEALADVRGGRNKRRRRTRESTIPGERAGERQEVHENKRCVAVCLCRDPNSKACVGCHSRGVSRAQVKELFNPQDACKQTGKIGHVVSCFCHEPGG